MNNLRQCTYSLTEQAFGAWGRRHRPTTTRLRVRAELLEAGGPELWDELMNGRRCGG